MMTEQPLSHSPLRRWFMIVIATIWGALLLGWLLGVFGAVTPGWLVLLLTVLPMLIIYELGLIGAGWVRKRFGERDE